MADIFLSYVRDDRSRAEQLAAILGQLGWNVWWDRKILPGRNFRRVIAQELQSAKCVVVLWSQKSVESDYVCYEADDAMRRQVLVPVLIEDVRPPHGFRQHEAANLIAWNGDRSDPQFELLRDGILTFAPASLPAAPQPLPAPERSSSDDAIPPPSPATGQGSNPSPALARRRYEFDLYISHSHIDDVPLADGERGWVSSLHIVLQLRLAQMLGKDVRIWRDPKLTGNDIYMDSLVEPLHTTALFLAVLSPRYLKSEWAQRELNEFVKAAEGNGGLDVAGRSRLVKVVKTPVPLEDTPAMLQSVLGYEFFRFDPVNGREVEIRHGPGTPDEREVYYMKVDDLAHDIADVLKTLEA